MTIYTKVGDNGHTTLPDGSTVGKDHPRIAAIGSVDELNAQIGLCMAADGARSGLFSQAFATLQAELFVLGADLASATKTLRLTDMMVARMEKQIDEIFSLLPPLHNFILPTGCELACRLHVARTVSRRAERILAAAQHAQSPVEPLMMRYLNRLSDLLFALARLANREAGGEEQIWHG